MFIIKSTLKDIATPRGCCLMPIEDTQSNEGLMNVIPQRAGSYHLDTDYR